VGKTLLAKATAGEAGVPFLNISGSDFVEIFVGVGPSRVRDMFKEARKKAPCIIFIDEIDAIGRSRKGGRAGGRNDERESTLNALLVEMDGFNTSSGVVVLAGTNRPDVLDKALLRPGRFDRQIALEAPPLADRIEIWMVHLKPITTDSSVSKEELAKGLATLSAGFSGADIMNACNEAALAAARLGAKEVCMEHFEKALDRIVGGLEKKNKVLSQWERKVVAHHEAGHAIVGWFSEWVDPLLKVSIQPRANGTLGFAQYLPKDKYIKTWRQIFEEMSMALGGRAAEKIVFDHLSTGASDDLQRVTKLAYAQVTKYGMSDEIGHVHFQQADDDDMVFNKPYSTKTEKAIDAVVRKLVDDAYDRTEKLLLEKKTELLAVAAALMEKEVLKTEDMVAILGERPSGMPDIYIAKKLKEAEEAAKSRREKEEGDAAEHEASASGAPEAAATPSPQ
jgi:ATP-dependent metalloprotease FtsH